MKTPEMNQTLDAVSGRLFGTTRSNAQATNACVSCGKDASQFRDQLSRKEYGISGLCQACQDQVFGVEPVTIMDTPDVVDPGTKQEETLP